MRILFTADLHQTDNPRDEYRWGLFEWLAEEAATRQVDRIILGGDLTDAKDKHSAELTNRMAVELATLGDIARVTILLGNHDYIDRNTPFFGFASNFQNVGFIKRPTFIKDTGILLLPHTRDHSEDWKNVSLKKAKLIFCHQTFDGCLAENGQKMEGIPPNIFGQTEAWSGDIHRPQKVAGSNINYVGAPYHIRFGDSFKPRIMLLDTESGERRALHYPTISKHLIELKHSPLQSLKRALANRNVQKGDQIKVRVWLERAEFPDWRSLKQKLAAMVSHSGAELWGIELRAIPEARAEAPDSQDGVQARPGRASPAQALASYAAREGLSPALLKAGKGLLAQAGKA